MTQHEYENNADGNEMILPSSLGSQLSSLPMFILPPFSPFMAMLKPCPSAPSRLPTGTTQSSKITARVGWEFQPTWGKNRTPSRLPKEQHTSSSQQRTAQPALNPSVSLPSCQRVPVVYVVWPQCAELETGMPVFEKRHRSNEP